MKLTEEQFNEFKRWQLSWWRNSPFWGRKYDTPDPVNESPHIIAVGEPHNVVALANHRPPVRYTVRLTHHWDDYLEVFVEDVADDDRSRAAIADALRRAADMLEDPDMETQRT